VFISFYILSPRSFESILWLYDIFISPLLTHPTPINMFKPIYTLIFLLWAMEARNSICWLTNIVYTDIFGSLWTQYHHCVMLECALTLTRDLAYIWPGCPPSILSVCNSSINNWHFYYLYSDIGLLRFNKFTLSDTVPGVLSGSIARDTYVPRLRLVCVIRANKLPRLSLLAGALTIQLCLIGQL
jgi:hypothetical protein